jgi:hypothetical protein
LIDSDRDFQLNSIFYGAGGELQINIDFKNIKKLKEDLYINYLILFLISSIILFLYVLSYSYKKLYLAVLLTIGFHAHIFMVLDKYITKIGNINKELKKYS